MGKKHSRREIIRALDLTYQKVWVDLQKQINAYDFAKRLKIAWLVLWGKL